jgi:hypothetical protein
VSNDATRVIPAAATPYAEALQANGISTQSASRYQRLAKVPEEAFEQALGDVVKPSTTRTIAGTCADAGTRQAGRQGAIR